MTLTAQQITTIDAQLSVDLATVTDDRLIELCLLYRSAPSVLPSFTTALETEITRRFTAAEIADNDVMFSVIQNFSNNFDPLNGYQDKFYTLATTDITQRDQWFRDNATMFYDAIHDAEALAWITNNVEIMSYIVASSVALAAVVVSSVAMTAVVTSSIAMTAVVASSAALSKIVASESARNVMMSNNTIFQSLKQDVYDTVKLTWTKHAGVSYQAAKDRSLDVIDNAVISPQGFVFASLGFIGALGITKITHSNGILAAAKGTSSKPTTLANLDAISFNAAKFTTAIDTAQAYAELWIPPTV